jgi:hypothetical protein
MHCGPARDAFALQGAQRGLATKLLSCVLGCGRTGQRSGIVSMICRDLSPEERLADHHDWSIRVTPVPGQHHSVAIWTVLTRCHQTKRESRG